MAYPGGYPYGAPPSVPPRPATAPGYGAPYGAPPGYGAPYPPPSGYPPQPGYPPQSGYPPQPGYPPGYPPNSGYGAPPAAPAIKPPPSSFNGWYTQYYNMITPQEMYQVHTMFNAIDKDHSGQITANELANVAVASVTLGMETAVKLVKVFDRDNSGTIDFYEYAALHKFLLQMQTVFAAGDVNRNGRLDAREIHTAINAGGIKIGFGTVQVLYRKYDKTGYGIDMGNFIQLSAQAALAKSIFEWKDTDNDGYVTLNLDQLLEVIANM